MSNCDVSKNAFQRRVQKFLSKC